MTITIAVFKTPVNPTKSFGVFILFSNGSTTPIPSNAYIAIPKYNGIVFHPVMWGKEFDGCKSSNMYLNIIPRAIKEVFFSFLLILNFQICIYHLPVTVSPEAINETGAKYFKFFRKLIKIIGISIAIRIYLIETS